MPCGEYFVIFKEFLGRDGVRRVAKDSLVGEKWGMAQAVRGEFRANPVVVAVENGAEQAFGQFPQTVETMPKA